MFTELNKTGFIVIDGINHYIYTKENNEMYLINGMSGSVIKIDKIDLYHPIATPDIVEKSIALLESRLKITDKIENKEIKKEEIPI